MRFDWPLHASGASPRIWVSDIRLLLLAWAGWGLGMRPLQWVLLYMYIPRSTYCIYVPAEVWTKYHNTKVYMVVLYKFSHNLHHYKTTLGRGSKDRSLLVWRMVSLSLHFHWINLQLHSIRWPEKIINVTSFIVCVIFTVDLFILSLIFYIVNTMGEICKCLNVTMTCVASYVLQLPTCVTKRTYICT